MTRREDQAKKIVTDVVIQGRIEIRGLAGILELVPELFMLALEQLVAAEEVDRTMLGRGHQPGARVSRHSRLGPLLEGRHERVVRQIFRHANIADHARQPGNELRRLDSPDCVDCLMCFRSRHDSIRPSGVPRCKRQWHETTKSPSGKHEAHEEETLEKTVTTAVDRGPEVSEERLKSTRRNGETEENGSPLIAQDIGVGTLDEQ